MTFIQLKVSLRHPCLLYFNKPQGNISYETRDEDVQYQYTSAEAYRILIIAFS